MRVTLLLVSLALLFTIEMQSQRRTGGSNSGTSNRGGSSGTVNNSLGGSSGSSSYNRGSSSTSYQSNHRSTGSSRSTSYGNSGSSGSYGSSYTTPSYSSDNSSSTRSKRRRTTVQNSTANNTGHRGADESRNKPKPVVLEEVDETTYVTTADGESVPEPPTDGGSPDDEPNPVPGPIVVDDEPDIVIVEVPGPPCPGPPIPNPHPHPHPIIYPGYQVQEHFPFTVFKSTDERTCIEGTVASLFFLDDLSVNMYFGYALDAEAEVFIPNHFAEVFKKRVFRRLKRENVTICGTLKYIDGVPVIIVNDLNEIWVGNMSFMDYISTKFSNPYNEEHVVKSTDKKKVAQPIEQYLY